MILKGDCIKVMKAMKPNSVDAIVCDPPYGLEFMGKEWDRLEGKIAKGMKLTGDGNPCDRLPSPSYTGTKRNVKCPDCGRYQYGHKSTEKNPVGGLKCECAGINKLKLHSMQIWHTQWLTEAYRVLKPGGSMLVMGGTRTSHRLACAIEDSGFIIKDTLMWIYGSGFPKAQDLGKMIDKRMGKERGKNLIPTKKGNLPEQAGDIALGATGFTDISEAQSDLAKHWDGFKVGGIKPAYEPIIWAVKPPEGSYVDNVLKHGVGAVNVDECRIGTDTSRGDRYNGKPPLGEGANLKFGKREQIWNVPKGRFPANVILSHHPECNKDCHPDCAVRILDEQSGMLKSGARIKDYSVKHKSQSLGVFQKMTSRCDSDSGGASRFFYCAKASRGERNAGLEGMEEKPVHWSSGHQNPGSFQAKGTKKEITNHHPTVKPIKLFEWLIKLVTREGQIILDPFIGSGTTAIAAYNTGRKCVGIEKEDEYLEIAKRRIDYWQCQPKQKSLSLGE